MRTPRSVGGTAVALLVTGLLAAGSLTACTAAEPTPPPPPPAPVRPGPSPDPSSVPGADRLGERVEAFLGASRWGRYDRVAAVLVIVDGQTVVERRRPEVTEQRREVTGFTAAVLVALVGILLDRSTADPGAAGALGTEGLRGVRRTPAELLPAPLPATLTDVAATPLHELLVGTSVGRTDQLAELLTAATGRPVPDLARELLFGPVGIDPPWTPTGPAMTAREMASVAALWLDRGAVGGRQIVPAGWMDAATRPYTDTGRRRLPYAGYRQWVTRAGGHAATVLTGQDGQLIEVVPRLDLVVVVACDEDPDPQVAFPAGSEAFVEMVSGTVVPALG